MNKLIDKHILKAFEYVDDNFHFTAIGRQLLL